MSPEESAIDMEAAQQRLRTILPNVTEAVLDSPQEWPTHCDHNVPIGVFCKECAKPAPKPPKKRRSDAGVPRPERRKQPAAPVPAVAGVLTEEQIAKITALVFVVRQKALARVDATRQAQYEEDAANRALGDYLRSLAGVK